jgi:hypothetical protein
MRVFTMLVVALVTAASVMVAADAMAQTQAPPPAGQNPPGAGTEAPQGTPQGEEKRVEGQIQSLDPSGTEITLTDGTKLATPPRTVLKPGVLSEGMTVIASYVEENGKKVLTALAVKESSAPGSGSGSPGAPSTAPPKRY